MRILQIDKFFDLARPAAGGAGTYIPLVTRRLRRDGHRVAHFGCAGPGGPAEMPRFIDYTDLGGLWSKLRGAARIVHDGGAAAKLDAFLAGRRVDVAHVHRIYHHLTPAILPVLRRRGIAVVMSVRDYRLLCPAKSVVLGGRVCMRCFGHRWHHCVVHNCVGSRSAGVAVAAETMIQRFFRRYINHVDLFLCPSRFMAAALVADGFPANKVRVLGNPIEPLAPGPPGPGPGTILTVGRLSEEKGLDLMLDVAAACPDREVALVGDGPMMPALRAEVASRGLGNVALAGHVPHAGLGAWYGRADVVVVPSRCLENSPHSMLEGMLAGRCVVAADHPPIREWIDDGRTGRLFASGDAGALASVVRGVLADEPARRRMGAEAAEMVRARHDPDDIVNRLVEAYRQAVERRCASR